MKLGQKRCQLQDGIVKGVVIDPNGKMNMVVFDNQHPAGKGSYERVTEEVSMRIPNPAQLEGIKEGDKIAVFTDALGQTNVVRKGEWRETAPIEQENPNNGKKYDNGVAVIMGRCIGARLVTPKEGQTFSPFFSLSVVTNDHVMHNISINNYTYTDKETGKTVEAKNIERAQKIFKEFLADGDKAFVPFEGTFITGRAYKEAEEENGQYTNKTRSYSGILNINNFLQGEFTKAPKSASRENAPQQEQDFEDVPEQETPFDASAEMGMDEDEYAFN